MGSLKRQVFNFIQAYSERIREPHFGIQFGMQSGVLVVAHRSVNKVGFSYHYFSDVFSEKHVMVVGPKGLQGVECIDGYKQGLVFDVFNEQPVQNNESIFN